MINSSYFNSLSFYINIFFLIIIIYLIIINRFYQRELDFFDLIKLYEISENDLITSEINIRKSNGNSCKIISEFPDSKYLDDYNETLKLINRRKDNDEIDEKEYNKQIEKLGKPKLMKFYQKRGDCL
jgi:hypothetical protein